MVLTPAMMHPRYRTFRAMLFSCMGGCGLAPIVYFAVTTDYAGCEQCRRITNTLAIELATYGVGMGLYAIRFPEKWYASRVALRASLPPQPPEQNNSARD